MAALLIMGHGSDARSELTARDNMRLFPGFIFQTTERTSIKCDTEGQQQELSGKLFLVSHRILQEQECKCIQCDVVRRLH
jgi:hypothetical protein